MNPGDTIAEMTPADTSWRNATFERQHAGRVEDETIQTLVKIIWRLTEQGWEGPKVEAKILTSDKPNGYVLATGQIYVTTGLLDLICTEDELAAVLAHELSHLRDPRGFQRARLSGSDRLAVEADADFRAVFRLLEAGYDPAALPVMIERLADQQPAGWALHRSRQLGILLGESPQPMGEPELAEVPADYCESPSIRECSVGQAIYLP